MSRRSTAGVTATHAYDGLGRLKQLTDPRTGGMKTSYVSGANLVDHTSYSNDNWIAGYSYDSAGRVQTVTDAGGFTRFIVIILGIR